MQNSAEVAVPSDLFYGNIDSVWNFNGLPRSEYHYEMIDGVVRVMNSNGEIIIDVPGTATNFFTDVHDVSFNCVLTILCIILLAKVSNIRIALLISMAKLWKLS